MRVWLLPGSFWIQKLYYPNPRPLPLTEKGNTQETEFPWRSGECWVFRIPFTRHAFALGRWVESHEAPGEDEPTLYMRPLPTWFET